MSGPSRFEGKWQTAQLSAMASIRDTRVEPSEVESGTLCVELEHIGQGNGRLTGYGAAERISMKYRFEDGDILFGRLRPYLRKWWRADRPGICSTEIWPLVPDPLKTDSTFLYALVQAGRLHDAANASYGTHMPRADWSIVAEVDLPLPPLAEQRAIAAVLMEVDALIGSLEALIAKKRAIKRAAMQQLLTGRTRLPGFEGEWDSVTVGRFAETYGGLTGKTNADFGSGSAQYVSFLDVLENVRITRLRFDRVRIADSESQHRVRPGDVLFNATSETPEDLAMGAVVVVDADDLYLNSFCFGLRIHDRGRCDPLFFAYLSRGESGRAAAYALAQGATRYNLSKRRFLALEFALPPRAEQRAIAAALSDMDAEIAALERRLDKTRAIKQGMMQQLLTGAARLPVPDDEQGGESHDA